MDQITQELIKEKISGEVALEKYLRKKTKEHDYLCNCSHCCRYFGNICTKCGEERESYRNSLGFCEACDSSMEDL